MKRIIQIKIVLLLLMMAFAYNQCGNPYTARPTELKFSGGTDAGVLTSNTSVDAFEQSVYRVTRQNCVGCHSTQNPIHASDDVQEAHDIVVNQFKVNFSNIPNSRLVAKLRDEAHNCWSDCAEDAQEMEEAIEAWAVVVNAAEEDTEDETDDEDNNGDGGDNTVVVTPGLTSVVAFEQTVHQVTKVRCTTCHINRFPRHANANVQVAHDGTVNGGAVDFNNVLNSRLVQRLSNDGHQCWSDCANDAAEMKAAIDQWILLQEDVVVETGGNNDGKTTTLSLPVSQAISENPVGNSNTTGYLEYDISEMLNTNETVTLRIKIMEFDEFSYQLWDPEIISNNLNVRVKGMKTLINGYYNPQHSAYTVVDTTTTPQSRSLSDYYLLALKDRGISLDKFSFQFEIVEVSN
jgi:hypothetical protein